MVSSGLKTKRHHACPWCMEQLNAWWSTTLGKMIYGYYRRKLPSNHPFWISLRMYFWQHSGKKATLLEMHNIQWMNLWVTTADNLHTPRMNRLSTLNSHLKYWKELPIRHLLDSMYIVKNVCHFFLLHLQRAKDIDSGRDDLKYQTPNICCGNQQNMELLPMSCLG
jgi:hypothetical protein